MPPPSRATALAAAVTLLAACASARARRDASPPPEAEPAWMPRAFELQGHGRLLLSLPPGWTATETDDGEAAVRAIRVDGPGGGFAAVLTPLWNPGEPDEGDDRADTAQLFAELGRRRALTGSVEREIPLEELSGPGVKGFWFTATDRELVGRPPAPDEWRSILQGAAAVGPVLLAFTLLDDGPGPQRALFLEVVRTARHVPGDEEEALADVEPIPEGRTVPLRVAWPGRSWAVLVDLPGFTAGERRATEGRGPLVVAVHRESGIVVSLSLLPADDAADAAGCRERALAAIASGIGEMADVRRAEVALDGSGPAARALYTASGADEGGVRGNAHAFLHRDGLCADVHVSKASPAPGDWQRMEEILATVRFGEDL